MNSAQPTAPGHERDNEAPLGAPTSQSWPPRAAVAARYRGRTRLRAVTAAIAATGLAVAGAVAFVLPGSSHASTSSGTTPSGSTGSAAASGSSGGTSSGSASSSGTSGS